MIDKYTGRIITTDVELPTYDGKMISSRCVLKSGHTNLSIIENIFRRYVGKDIIIIITEKD
jgi:hypothetical protein